MIVVHGFSLSSLQKTFEARASEWMLTGAVICLALVFSLNENMFFSPAFEGLRGLNSSRAFWIVVLALIGLTRLSVLIINGAYWRTPHFRAVTAFLCSGIWFMLCAAFARNGSMLIAILPWIFLLDVYNARRAGHEAGQSEFIQRHIRKTQGLTNGISTQPHT